MLKISAQAVTVSRFCVNCTMAQNGHGWFGEDTEPWTVFRLPLPQLNVSRERPIHSIMYTFTDPDAYEQIKSLWNEGTEDEWLGIIFNSRNNISLQQQHSLISAWAERVWFNSNTFQGMFVAFCPKTHTSLFDVQIGHATKDYSGAFEQFWQENSVQILIFGPSHHCFVFPSIAKLKTATYEKKRQ